MSVAFRKDLAYTIHVKQSRLLCLFGVPNEYPMKKSTVRLLARSNRPVCIAHASTNNGHTLAVCAAAHGDVLTLKATRDG